MFSKEDKVGTVKRFEVGEYKDNLLPLIFTKTCRHYTNQLTKKECYCFTVQVEKDGVQYSIEDLDFEEVFKE